jgi:hypothetical protein
MMTSRSSKGSANSPTTSTVRAELCVVPEMKNVSQEAKSLISRILLPDAKRMTCEDIFRDAWVLKEAAKTPLKVDFSRMVGFTKYSKVCYPPTSDKKIGSHIHSDSALIKGGIKLGSPLQTNRPQPRRLDLHRRAENRPERLEEPTFPQRAGSSHELDRHRPQRENKLHIIFGFLHGASQTFLRGAHQKCIQDD